MRSGNCLDEGKKNELQALPFQTTAMGYAYITDFKTSKRCLMQMPTKKNIVDRSDQQVIGKHNLIHSYNYAWDGQIHLFNMVISSLTETV